MKRCNQCKRKYPLIMFGKSTRAFLYTDYKRLRSCRICTFIESKNPVMRIIDGKFKKVQLTFKERIKELFKK